MYYSIRGRVSQIETKFLVVESSGIGYEILVANPDSFSLGEEVFLYLHHEIKEDDEYLAGFRTIDEKNAFKLLLHVNGIGPKSALIILGNVDYNDLLVAISNNDFEFIEKIPGISARVASQILLDLKEYIIKCNRENANEHKEIREALKSLKFKVKDIDKAMLSIYIPNGTKEDIFKEALKRLNYAKNFG